MVQKKNQMSIPVMVMLILTAAAILLMIVTPVLFFSYRSTYSVGTHALMGWTGLFGGTLNIYQNNNGVQSTFRSFVCDFSWQYYLTFLVMIITAATAYFIGPKAKWYYIVAGILFALCSVMFFTAKVWFQATIAGLNANSYETNSAMHLGIGPWAAAFFNIASALACWTEFALTYKKK